MGLGRALRSAATITTDWTGTFQSSDFVTFGAERTGINASKTEMLGLTPVYRAINFLANTQSLLELEAYKKSDRSQVDWRLLDNPSGNWQFTCAEWKDYELRSRLIYGNSYAIKAGMTPISPWPSILYPIHPSRVTPYGVFAKGVLKEVNYLVQPSNAVNQPPPEFKQIGDMIDAGAMWLDRSTMFHVAGQNFDGVQGQSPIDACAAALAIGVATETAAGKFFGRGQLMSGFLRTKNRLDEKQALALKRRWTQKMAGIDNAYDVAVMDNDLEFQQLSVTPEQSQFIEMRQFGVEEIARIFGVPPFLLMAANAGNSFGTGLEQQLTATDIFTLSFWFKSLEDRATLELLPSTQYAQFDKSPLIRADVKTRWASYAIARQNQLVSINEIREQEGLVALSDPDADDAMLPPPKGAAADQPGGNSGAQGGGSEADPNVVA